MSRRKYTKKERAELLRIYESGRANGLTAMDAAKEAGVPYITLRSWQLKSRDSKQEKFRKDIAKIVTSPVEPVPVVSAKLEEPEEPNYPRLVLTSGNIVEGPLEGLIEILKAVEGRA